VMEKILMYITLVTALGSIVYQIFITGKAFGKLTTSLDNAIKDFNNSVNSLRENFDLQIENICSTIKELKTNQEKLTDILNDIIVRQLREIEKDVCRIDESTKSAHHRLDEIRRDK